MLVEKREFTFNVGSSELIDLAKEHYDPEDRTDEGRMYSARKISFAIIPVLTEGCAARADSADFVKLFDDLLECLPDDQHYKKMVVSELLSHYEGTNCFDPKLINYWFEKFEQPTVKSLAKFLYKYTLVISTNDASKVVIDRQKKIMSFINSKVKIGKLIMKELGKLFRTQVIEELNDLMDKLYKSLELIINESSGNVELGIMMEKLIVVETLQECREKLIKQNI